MPAPATPRIEAPLIEVFSSIQGEGVHVGLRQVFVRFAGCNLSCDYCDTPFAPTSACRIETSPGSGAFNRHDNPVDLNVLTALLAAWRDQSPGLHHSVSLTGGEPLLHAGILAEWLPSLREALPVHLETNGTLPEAMGSLVHVVDWVSMDIKTASTAGAPTPWDAHADFIAAAADRLCQVKVVVGAETTVDDVAVIARFLCRQQVSAPLILQPRTRDGRVAASPAVLLEFQRAACAETPLVRVIPQLHVFLDLL